MNKKCETWDQLKKDNPTKPIKWDDIIGDLPEIKDDDVIDVYVYKNGVLVWPKK